MKRWAAGLFISLFFLYNQCGVLSEGETSARAACIMDMETGRVLFEHNMHARLPMASTTKVMTALLALELGRMDDQVVCSERAFGVSGTSIYLSLGESLALSDMLLGLMLSSGNDAAVAIGEHIGGTLDAFVALMNARARVIGAVNTRFQNPHGLPDEQHYTTAYDLTLIAREAMKNEAFRALVSTQKATIPWEGRSYSRQLNNKNRLLSSYPGATGIKTGYTSKAGRCLVFGAKRNGMELVGVVLGCADWFDEAQRLLDRCFADYSMTGVLGPLESAGEMPVIGGEVDKVPMCLMEELRIPLAEGETGQIILSVPQQVHAPVYPGMHLGTAHLVVDGKAYSSCEVVASARVDSSHVTLDVMRVLAHWTL